MRRSLFAYFVTAVVVGAFCAKVNNAASQAPARDLFDAITGKWAWSDNPKGCAEDAHHITFSADRKRAQFRTDKPSEYKGKLVSEFSYTVLYAEDNRITLLLDDEDRRTVFGDRVVWVLIFVAPDTYRWRRTDWTPDSGTPDVIRCK